MTAKISFPTKFSSLFAFLAVLVLSAPASAHIPKLMTILSKVAGNNGGTNGLVIKKKLTIKEGNVSCLETWYVANADLMKLEVSGTDEDGGKWAFEILYKDGRRTTNTEEGGQKNFPYSQEFYEPLLHYRSSRALLSKLVSLQMVPTWAGGNSNQEGFISLDRLKGSLVYLMGAGETKNTAAPPQIWIEQDSFVVKKVRLGSQVEVDFESFKDHSEKKDVKILQPDSQTVFWKSTTVNLQNTSLEVVSQAKIAGAFKLKQGESAKLPDNVNLKEFYSRFR